MMKVLVTGAAGFIGSNLCSRLLKEHHEVIALDNLSTGRYENIKAMEKELQFHKIDIRDLEEVKKVMRNVDYVLHQAALGSVQRSLEKPLDTHGSNVDGTLNMLVAAKEAGIKRFVYASSSSIYGDTPTLPKVETMLPSPKSPYAISKFAGEEYTRVFYELYGLETVSLRYFNVFGPAQDPTSIYAAVIPKFISAVKSGKEPVIFGDGEQSRDFTYIENVVEANLLALKAKQGFGETYNIACNKRISINELLASLNKIMGKGTKAQYKEARKGDVKHSLADIGKARKVLGYEPVVEFFEGLKKTVESFRQGA